MHVLTNMNSNGAIIAYVQRFISVMHAAVSKYIVRDPNHYLYLNLFIGPNEFSWLLLFEQYDKK